MLLCMTRNDPGDRLAAAVHEARLARKWSKEEAARRAGVTAPTWKRVEDGLPIQEHNLHAIAAALGWEPGRAFRLKAGDELAALHALVSDDNTASKDELLEQALSLGEQLARTLEALKKEQP